MEEQQRPLPSIPIPPAQRWREVRLLFLPRIVFVLGMVAAAMIWSRWVTPAAIVAEAEVMQAEVRSAQAGVLVGLKVGMFQTVQANEVIGHVAVVDPRILEATLAVIRAEVGMLSVTMAGATDRQRVALEYERLLIDWLNSRVELASLRGRLQMAESDLTRVTPLHRGGVVSEEDYTRLKLNRDSLLEEVAEQGRLVARLEPLFAGPAGTQGRESLLSSELALSSSIKVAEAKLKLAEQQMTPVALTSPISGVVSLVLRRSGEAVVAGEPIVRVTASRPEKLMGFLRQPLPFEPKVGMAVEVRSRSMPRKVASSTILQIGTAMETITPSLVAAMRLPPVPLPEPGLRIQLALPEGLNLRPGEFVDVVLP